MRHGMTKDMWLLSHLYRVGRSSAPSGTSNGHTCSDAETTPACCCHRCPERPPLRRFNARSTLGCVDGSSPDLESGLHRTVMQSRLEVRQHGSAMPRISESLRGALANIFAKANVPTDCGCNGSQYRGVANLRSRTLNRFGGRDTK